MKIQILISCIFAALLINQVTSLSIQKVENHQLIDGSVTLMNHLRSFIGHDEESSQSSKLLDSLKKFANKNPDLFMKLLQGSLTDQQKAKVTPILLNDKDFCVAFLEQIVSDVPKGQNCFSPFNFNDEKRKALVGKYLKVVDWNKLMTTDGSQKLTAEQLDTVTNSVKADKRLGNAVAQCVRKIQLRA